MRLRAASAISSSPNPRRVEERRLAQKERMIESSLTCHAAKCLRRRRRKEGILIPMVMLVLR